MTPPDFTVTGCSTGHADGGSFIAGAFEGLQAVFRNGACPGRDNPGSSGYAVCGRLDKPASPSRPEPNNHSAAGTGTAPRPANSSPVSEV